jgi:hypothetical protein
VIDERQAALIEQAARSIAGRRRSSALGDLPTLSRDGLELLIHRVSGESLDGVLFEAAEAGLVRIPTDSRDRLARQHQTAMTHVLRLERLADSVDAAFRSAGIESRLLKGMALAHGVYDDPAYRSFADLDVLVPPSRVAAAIDALGELGAVRVLPELRPGHDARFAKDITFLLDGLPIDLHRTLISGPFGERLPIDDLFARSRTVVIGGTPFDGLEIGDAYLHAGLSAGAADVPPKLITLRDLVELERHPVFHAAEVLDRALAWGIGAPVARAIRLADATVRPTERSPLLPWAEQYRATALDRAHLDAYLDRRRRYRRALLTVLELPGWRDRAVFLRNHALPSAEYRRARGWSATGHLRRAFGKR